MRVDLDVRVYQIRYPIQYDALIVLMVPKLDASSEFFGTYYQPFDECGVLVVGASGSGKPLVVMAPVSHLQVGLPVKVPRRFRVLYRLVSDVIAECILHLYDCSLAEITRASRQGRRVYLDRLVVRYTGYTKVPSRDVPLLRSIFHRTNDVA